MAATTRIEWCDATWNPITGCTPCSPGCEHCYARRMAERFPQVHGDDLHGGFPGGDFGCVHFHSDRLDQPLCWRRPRRVLVCSLGDLFHENVQQEWRCRTIDEIILAHWHTFMVLTKRPQNIGRAFASPEWPCGAFPNAWLGATVCNQAEADAKIPVLLATPAALRFVSIEPMLGPVDLAAWLPWGPHDDAAKLDWTICGGETGPGARPMQEVWASLLGLQCQAAGVPFFYKGAGTAAMPKRDPCYHLLAGREWHQFPEVTP